MKTIEMVRLYKTVAAKPTPRSVGRRALREWLLRSLEQELRLRAQEAARLVGIAAKF